MLESVNYALLYAYFGGICAALCVFWWNMHDFMRLCRVLVVAVSGGIVHGTLFTAWCLVFDVIVTHFFFLSVTHRHEVVIYRTQNTADTDIRPATKFKRAKYEHKRHDYTSHAT